MAQVAAGRQPIDRSGAAVFIQREIIGAACAGGLSMTSGLGDPT